MRNPGLILPTAVLGIFLPLAAFAQATPAPASNTCTALVQAASNAVQARIAADNAALQPPQSVTSLSCLGNFFNGVGLNVITNFLNPTNLLTAVEGQICSAVQSTWQSWLGATQCGLTITGFNLGFSAGLGTGAFCPKLTFGGGGPPLGGVSLGGNGNGGINVNGAATLPQGYSAPTDAGLW